MDAGRGELAYCHVTHDVGVVEATKMAYVLTEGFVQVFLLFSHYYQRDISPLNSSVFSPIFFFFSPGFLFCLVLIR